MRPKFVFALLLFACLVVGAAWFLKEHLGGGTEPSANAGPATFVPPVHSNVVVMAASPLAPKPASLPVVPPSTNTAMPPTNTVAPEPSQEAIDAEVDRLQDWSMNDDPESLSNILADLTNSVKEVREAAIDAAKQFGSTNAIPALKAAAETTDDLQEKIAYLEAADFLSLPPLEFSGLAVQKTPEQIQKQRDAIHAVRQQMIMQRHPQNQNSQSATPPANGQNSPTAPNHN